MSENDVASAAAESTLSIILLAFINRHFDKNQLRLFYSGTSKSSLTATCSERNIYGACEHVFCWIKCGLNGGNYLRISK